MKIAISNPSVAPHVKQSVMAYQDAGFLEHFYTSFFEHPGNKLSTFLKKIGDFEKVLKRRSFHNLPIEKFASRPLPELLRSFSSRKLSPVITDRIWEWAELEFDEWVASRVNSEIDAIHTYEHAALATLSKAKSLNKFCIYEQPSVYHAFFRQIAEGQLALYPELNSKTMDLKVNAKADRRNRRRDKELQMADMIICNSSFTRSTLSAAGVNPAKIFVLPLAFPAVGKTIKQKDNSGPIIFLHAGNQSLTKASHLLYQAWRACNLKNEEAELWLIGKMSLPEVLRNNLPGKVIIKDNIPHSELMALYQNADVLVMPTLADGFGMVITEAMSQGVPVIATNNCGGPDVIKHMKNGWLIPAADVTALIGQMQWCINNREELPSYSREAKAAARLWQWPQYRKKLIEITGTGWEQFKEKSA
jgi:glycosyltransferase involved in cell wall biosynthesis